MPTGHLDPDVAAQVRALASAATAVDGVAALSEATDLALDSGDDRDTHVLITDQASDDASHPNDRISQHEPALTAYGHLRREPDGTSWAELVVHPDHRRRGLGTSLLSEVLDKAPDAGVWAHGDLAPAHEFAAARGLRAVRDLWQMARPVDADPTIEQPTPPEGFAIRSFVVDQDEQAWLDVNARAFAHHPEQGRMTMADLRQRMAEPWFDPEGLRLIEDRRGAQPVLAASHWTKIADPSSGEGEVYVVAVDPAYQGHGLGRIVTAAGLSYLKNAGMRSIDLYVEGDNEPAIATYRRWGFTRRAQDVMYRAMPAPNTTLQG